MLLRLTAYESGRTETTALVASWHSSESDLPLSALATGRSSTSSIDAPTQAILAPARLPVTATSLIRLAQYYGLMGDNTGDLSRENKVPIYGILERDIREYSPRVTDAQGVTE